MTVLGRIDWVWGSLWVGFLFYRMWKRATPESHESTIPLIQNVEILDRNDSVSPSSSLTTNKIKMKTVETKLSELNYYCRWSHFFLDAGLKSDHMRSPITSPSWRGLPTSQDNQVVTPPPAKPKQLFGSSLTDLCEDDTLPGPLLVGHILVSLAPWVEGREPWKAVFSPKSVPK